MDRTWMKGLMAALMSALMAPCIVHAQDASQAGSTDSSGYLAQHFSFQALNADVQNAVVRANLGPVPFQKITLRTRDVVTSPDQPQPTTYTSTATLENAGHGLVRRVEALQDKNGSTVATRLDLTYRGYFSFLTQSIPMQAKAMPPVQEARKVLRFDTGTNGHVAFVYLYGISGGQTFQDPGQFLCDSGKRYGAEQLNPAMQGQVQELDCRVIDTNGIETDKVAFAYLEQYGVAVTLRTRNPQRTIDSTIVDFSVH